MVVAPRGGAAVEAAKVSLKLLITYVRENRAGLTLVPLAYQWIERGLGPHGKLRLLVPRQLLLQHLEQAVPQGESGHYLF